MVDSYCRPSSESSRVSHGTPLIFSPLPLLHISDFFWFWVIPRLKNRQLFFHFVFAPAASFCSPFRVYPIGFFRAHSLHSVRPVRNFLPGFLLPFFLHNSFCPFLIISSNLLLSSSSIPSLISISSAPSSPLFTISLSSSSSTILISLRFIFVLVMSHTFLFLFYIIIPLFSATTYSFSPTFSRNLL